MIAMAPLNTQLEAIYDVAKPNALGISITFRSGRVAVWEITAPPVPINEMWIDGAVTGLLERMVADLRDGASEPKVKRDRQGFRETNWDVVTAALFQILAHWAKRRIEIYRGQVVPQTLQ